MEKPWILITVYEGEIEIDTYATEQEAEDALMRDIYEMGQDLDLPDRYDPTEISNWFGENGVEMLWTIRNLED